MNRAMVLVVGLTLCVGCAHFLFAQNYTILHEFAGLPADGYNPCKRLTTDGNRLYGMTARGGTHDRGIIFSMGIDGSGYTILHEFGDIADDGRWPQAGFVLNNGTLYGMASRGGTHDHGTIFSIGTDGSGYNIFHEFDASADDGQWPFGSPILEDNRLYGMTENGGAHDDGVIFSIGTDGSGFTLLHSFSDAAGNGPRGTLLSDGSTLYGMTEYGGADGEGVAFSIGIDGSNFDLLHTFSPGPNDGENPRGTLISDNSTLYGVTHIGGAGWVGGDYYGTIFSVGIDGSDFTVLHNCTGGRYDASNPSHGVVSHGSRLYGLSNLGGIYNGGTLFSIGTDGSDFTIHHDFAGGVDDGSFPSGVLLLEGYTLYGMTDIGGDDNRGVIFSYALPTPTPTPTPLIDLNVNKTTFSTADRITVTADVAPTSISFQPYVSIDIPDGRTLYYVRGTGFTPVQTPYLSGGPFVLRNPITNYRVLDVSFSGVPTGAYTLNGWGNDIFGNTIGHVDQEQLTVQ